MIMHYKLALVQRNGIHWIVPVNVKTQELNEDALEDRNGMKPNANVNVSQASQSLAAVHKNGMNIYAHVVAHQEDQKRVVETRNGMKSHVHVDVIQTNHKTVVQVKEHGVTRNVAVNAQSQCHWEDAEHTSGGTITIANVNVAAKDQLMDALNHRYGTVTDVAVNVLFLGLEFVLEINVIMIKHADVNALDHQYLALETKNGIQQNANVSAHL